MPIVLQLSLHHFLSGLLWTIEKQLFFFFLFTHYLAYVMHLQQQVNSWFFVSSLKSGLTYPHPRFLKMKYMSACPGNLQLPWWECPTCSLHLVLTHFMMTIHIGQLLSHHASPALPRIASFLYLQCTPNTHTCSKSAQRCGSGIYCSGPQQLRSAGTVSAMLSKSIRLHLYTHHGHDQGFWMHGRPDRFIAR